MDLKNFKITITSHVLTSGPSDELINYLKKRAGRIIYIGHPFPFAKKTNSFYKIYEKDKCIKEHRFFIGKFPDVLNYVKDFLLTLFWMLFFERQDLYIGVNGFNAVCGIILKKVGKVKKVIFYTIDYVPNRFESPILNFIYHAFDRFAIAHSDLVWNLSNRMAHEREKRGISSRFRGKQIRVPIGTDLNLRRLENTDRGRYDIAFMGNLRKGHGLELLLSSFKDVLAKIPEAKLHIFGAGPLQESLKKEAIEIGIVPSIDFRGGIEDHGELLDELSKCAIAVAPYEDTPENFTRYTDPGKPKVYFSAGLPVVITRVPEVSDEIEREGCGKAVGYSRQEIADAIVEILSDEQKLKNLRQNIRKIVLKYEWNKVFDEAFDRLN